MTLGEPRWISEQLWNHYERMARTGIPQRHIFGTGDVSIQGPGDEWTNIGTIASGAITTQTISTGAVTTDRLYVNGYEGELDMAIRTDVDQLRQDAQKAVLDLASAEAVTKRFPTEPPPGTVLKYKGKASGAECTYVCVSVKDDYWQIVSHSTGNTRALTWGQLVSRIGTNDCWFAPNDDNWLKLPDADKPVGSEAKNAEEWFQLVYGGDKK